MTAPLRPAKPNYVRGGKSEHPVYSNVHWKEALLTATGKKLRR